MNWSIEHVFNFTQDKPWGGGFCQFGFHGRSGNQYLLSYEEHWIGLLLPNDEFEWTAGATDKGLSGTHIPFDLKRPHYLTESPDGSLLVSSNGTNKIFKVYPDRKTAEVFVDTGKLGLKNLGNCEYDKEGNIWVNDFTGCRIWQFDPEGRPKRFLGNGTPGFQKGSVPFEKARFSWAYDLRLGPDGNIYVLDSKNFAVRMIDLSKEVVTLVAGTGDPGFAGDGGSALNAQFGSDKNEYFDGPLSLSLDEAGNIYVGDTFNHVVRMVEASTRIIRTIAGKREIQPHKRNDPNETDPLKLNLPKICSMEYWKGQLFVPEWDGDLVVLKRSD